jgi:uncharacterized protein YacL (UPF0231 family)
MDYEFQRDILGRFEASFSMEHEAFGNWLTQEVSDDKVLAQRILASIDLNKKHWSLKHSGNEYDLHLSHEQAEIKAHSLNMDESDIPEELEVFDGGSAAHCGIEDFVDLLQSWIDFI